MGFRSNSHVTEVEIPDWSTFEQLELPYKFRMVLDGIVQTCKGNNIQLIFFTALYAGEFNYGRVMEQYASEQGCIYIDFFKILEEVGIDGKTDFQDKGHLNTNGANKLANYLGNYIVSNYNLEDKRLIESNIWKDGF